MSFVDVRGTVRSICSAEKIPCGWMELLTLHSMTEMKPMPPIAPTVPVLSTQWSQPWAKTGTQPFVTKACTSTNIEKANGTSLKGKCMTTAVAVGNVSWQYLYPSAMSEANVVLEATVPLIAVEGSSRSASALIGDGDDL